MSKPPESTLPEGFRELFYDLILRAVNEVFDHHFSAQISDLRDRLTALHEQTKVNLEQARAMRAIMEKNQAIMERTNDLLI